MRISQWCCKNSLLINPDKTKVLAVGVPQLLQKLSSFSITLFDQELTPVHVVKDFFLDTRLNYNEHIIKTASNCLFKLKQINGIKDLLDRKTLLLVINSFGFSKLHYYMANPVLGKSLCSDWFFLGHDFAVRTVSMETVQSVYFCFGAKPANSKFATKTAKKK